MSECEQSVNNLNIINRKTWTNGYQSSMNDGFYSQKHLAHFFVFNIIFFSKLFIWD
jgi:hypothetical protein